LNKGEISGTRRGGDIGGNAEWLSNPCSFNRKRKKRFPGGVPQSFRSSMSVPRGSSYLGGGLRLSEGSFPRKKRKKKKKSGATHRDKARGSRRQPRIRRTAEKGVPKACRRVGGELSGRAFPEPGPRKGREGTHRQESVFG